METDREAANPGGEDDKPCGNSAGEQARRAEDLYVWRRVACFQCRFIWEAARGIFEGGCAGIFQEISFAKGGEGCMIQSSNGEFFVTCRQSGGNEQKLLILKNAADSGKSYTISVTLYGTRLRRPESFS